MTILRDRDILVSCGADGATKVWDLSTPGGAGSLRSSWSYNGLGGSTNPSPIGATAVEGLRTDLRGVAVAYQDAVVKLFDIETGKEMGKLRSDSSSGKKSQLWRGPSQVLIIVTIDGTANTQINSLVSHPTMPLIVTAHEDRYIRIFDITTGASLAQTLSHCFCSPVLES